MWLSHKDLRDRKDTGKGNAQLNELKYTGKMVMSRQRQEDGSAQKGTKSQSHASQVCKTVFLEK